MSFRYIIFGPADYMFFILSRHTANSYALPCPACSRIRSCTLQVCISLLYIFDHLAYASSMCSPGVHFLQDPRSGVYNYSRYLQDIPDIKDFDFERLTPFVKSSRDDVICRIPFRQRDLFNISIRQALKRFAKEREKKFAGSTSSLTGLLSHIYFLISNDHPVNTSLLPAPFNKAVCFPPFIVTPVNSLILTPNSQDHSHPDNVWRHRLCSTTTTGFTLSILNPWNMITPS